jgi:CubicO group peptidase (beta-lactamase class C family)
MPSAGTTQGSVLMDEVVQFYVDKKAFTGSVLVAQGSEVLFNKAYGSANLEWAVPNTPATKFRLASVTKQFTAACVLLLEERGRLNLDHVLKNYLSDLPEAWDGITIRHLLTHTSGIPNYVKHPEYAALAPFSTPAEKLIAIVRDDPLDFMPGEKWSYSDSGYILIGCLIEKVSEEKYETFLSENILKPLGMHDSGYRPNEAILPQSASGYVVHQGQFWNAGIIHTSGLFSASGLHGTTGDLLLWQNGLYGGKVLSAASLEEMTMPGKANYGLGVWVHSPAGKKVIEHGGGTPGFNSVLSYYPEKKLTVAVLANLSGLAGYEISKQLGAIAHGERPAERTEVSISPEALERLTGIYELMPGVTVTITLEADKLMLQITGQPKVDMFAQSDASFFLKIVEARIEFIKDSSGAATHLILHQGGKEYKAMRK